MIDQNRIEKFLDDPDTVKAVKDAILSFTWFDIEEFNKINDTELTNTQLGEITRSYVTATKLIKQSFKELEKLKKVKVDSAPGLNPAR